MKADLHLHTTFSDGKYSVDEVLDMAVYNYLDYVAITDHDTFDGVKLALKSNKKINVIIGIELSTYYNEESVHILGYFNNFENMNYLQPILNQQVLNRKTRAYRILEKLKELYQIDLDPYFIEELDSVTRGSIAREIVKQGYPYTTRDVFKTMLGDDCPAYIPSTKMDTKMGIDLIHQSNGIAVLAHPMELKKSDPLEIISLGVDGIEAIYPHREDQVQKYRQYAKNKGLLITAGTDFHTFNDGRHGNIGDVYLKGEDLDQFLKELYEH